LKENLTSYRKFLFGEAKNLKSSLDFKFLWTWMGHIFMRKSEISSVFKISSDHDLTKIPNSTHVAGK